MAAFSEVSIMANTGADLTVRGRDYCLVEPGVYSRCDGLNTLAMGMDPWLICGVMAAGLAVILAPYVADRHARYQRLITRAREVL
jgi:hypothetical protein